MPTRLLADTCAALKIAALGEKVFKAGALPLGDLILHPLLFQETKKWPEERRKNFSAEFAILAKVRATPNLQPPAKELEVHLEVIDMTQDAVGRSIGRVDKNILAAVLFDGEMGLVTNDGSLYVVASEGLSVETYMAEDIVCESVSARLVTLAEAQAAINRWHQTGDGIARGQAKQLQEIGIKLR
jgi:hypothetical protein